jgi:putative iron-only hydrogenase system regulator
MEKRIGAVLVLVSEEGDIQKINTIISEHSDLILGRQGIPLRDRDTNVISLVLEGDTDLIGSLTGKLGRIHGVKVRSMLAG